MPSPSTGIHTRGRERRFDTERAGERVKPHGVLVDADGLDDGVEPGGVAREDMQVRCVGWRWSQRYSSLAISGKNTDRGSALTSTMMSLTSPNAARSVIASAARRAVCSMPGADRSSSLTWPSAMRALKFAALSSAIAARSRIAGRGEPDRPDVDARRGREFAQQFKPEAHPRVKADALHERDFRSLSESPCPVLSQRYPGVQDIRVPPRRAGAHATSVLCGERTRSPRDQLYSVSALTGCQPPKPSGRA